MKNKDIFRYYLYQKEVGGEYTAKYDKYRKKVKVVENQFNLLKNFLMF